MKVNEEKEEMIAGSKMRQDASWREDPVGIQDEQQERLREQLQFANALHRLAEAIIIYDDTSTILETIAAIAGETLNVDRSLIYDMDFEKYLLIALCEWHNPGVPEITATKDTYNMDVFANGTRLMREQLCWQESHIDDVDPVLFGDGSANLLHNLMSIKSGLWYPFSFRKEGYYCLVFNQVGHRRVWREVELNFINSVAKQVEIAIQKIDFLKDRMLAEKRLQEQLFFLQRLYRTKNGEVRVGLLSTERIGIGGEPCLLCVVNDITERRLLEKKMARLDQLHLIGEMVASIAHEIRNPMTTVRGFLQILAGKADCARYKDYYSLMIEELDRANSIISEFLSLARNKVVDKKMVSLNAILNSLWPLIQADAAKSDKYVNLDLEKTPDLLLNDKDVRQIVLNLARNGLEAMPANGVLTIRTFTEGEQVVLAVEDQGGGISPDALEKLGTPFFTTKDKGTGLGLAVCYSIADCHKASIKVETSPQGTTFFVRLGMEG